MANETEEGSDERVVSHSTDSTTVCHNIKPKKPTARLRWDLLSKALHKKSDSIDVESEPHLASVRRFESFGLIQLKTKYNDSNDSSHDLSTDLTETHVNKELLLGNWFECSLWDQSIGSFGPPLLEIKILTEKIPIYELLHSLDNTGNVCLWPSEEVLTYYVYKNSNLCLNKTVLELGGGMTCLCALLTAVSVAAKRVVLTDGNQRCVSNVKAIVERNRYRLQSTVECRQLIWGEDSHFTDLYNQIDVIFCSDCLYFDQSRHLLVDTIHKLLKSTGIAILLAPTRGSTFNSFVDLVKEKFDFEIIENYDQLVDELNKKFVSTAVDCHYVPDLHYPVMIELSHKTSSAKHH